MKVATFLFCLLFILSGLGAYEVSLHGGARLDIPEAWILDESDSAVPSWYSPDSRNAVEILLWEPGSWSDMQSFVDETIPLDAQGDIISFPCWDGEAALVNWVFPVSGTALQGWFLYVRGTSGPDIMLSALSAEEDFAESQPFLLSVVDSYIPSDDYRLYPGAVSIFLELSGESGEVTTVASNVGNMEIQWEESAAGNQAAQDVIEREALVLTAYAGVPELFYPAWERYYRLIYRDGYHRLDTLARALDEGPLPVSETDTVVVADTILNWLQGFEYGSIEGVSDLLAPSSACSTATGDCDSLSLVLIMLMQRYGVESRLILTHQAHHAVTGLNLPGEGLRLTDDEGSWLVAELTTELPLGQLPERLNGVSDWFAIDLFTE